MIGQVSPTKENLGQAKFDKTTPLNQKPSSKIGEFQ
jgi:hypothetical protein